MKRNYLPPSLKMSSTSNGGQSPPLTAASPSPTTASTPTTSTNANNSARKYWRPCKLPTVQEVGK